MPVLVVALLAGCGSSQPTASRTTPRGSTQHPAVSVRRISTLPAPVQDPAVAGLDSSAALLLGGLSSADVSVAGIERATVDRRAASVGLLPAPLHDAAAANVGGNVYLFGGGNVSPSAEILRVGSDGRSRSVGRLPVAASDVAAAALGGAAYIIGGYTGQTALDTIVAWRPGSVAKVVARLPQPLRYAAVAGALDGSVIIAGGTAGATAASAILRFDPRTNRITQIGTLPRPLTHAAGATLGSLVYVIGGRGASLSSQTASVLAIDPRSGHVTRAGHLPGPTSDAGAASLGNRILLAGGRDRAGRVSAAVLLLARRSGAP